MTELKAEQIAVLMAAATEARRHAYAPYSKYPVGAAILTASGSVHAGANVENAAFPSGMCAERVAIFDAIARGEREVRAVVVVTENGGAPCGACRQVLAEFGPEAEIILVDATGNISLHTTLRDLLPRAFRPEDLPGR
jgi:cytidine deaminase